MENILCLWLARINIFKLAKLCKVIDPVGEKLGAHTSTTSKVRKRHEMHCFYLIWMGKGFTQEVTFELSLKGAQDVSSSGDSNKNQGMEGRKVKAVFSNGQWSNFLLVSQLQAPASLLHSHLLLGFHTGCSLCREYPCLPPIPLTFSFRSQLPGGSLLQLPQASLALPSFCKCPQSSAPLYPKIIKERFPAEPQA